MKKIDLRSDTLTRPSSAMRQAMAQAEVGDDVYGEDPTVRRLEERAAEISGLEAGLFVPSGTMGNQIAMRVHGRPGNQVLCEENSHVVHYESGGLAVLSGLMCRCFSSAGGPATLEQIAPFITRGSAYESQTDVLVIENSHNVAGGVVTPVSNVAAIVEQAQKVGVRCHLDGARVFNAALACGVPVSALTSMFDSVMFCLSKGLGAPVGSMLCGTSSFVEHARDARRLFGGGMRQVGVLAAAGLVALDESPALLERDHEHASKLARALSQVEGLTIDPKRVETNIVVAQADCQQTLDRIVKALAAQGVLAGSLFGNRFRMVAHRDVTSAEIDLAVSAIEKIAGH
jgi:threonine aldolase